MACANWFTPMADLTSALNCSTRFIAAAGTPPSHGEFGSDVALEGVLDVTRDLGFGPFFGIGCYRTTVGWCQP